MKVFNASCLCRDEFVSQGVELTVVQIRREIAATFVLHGYLKTQASDWKRTFTPQRSCRSVTKQ